MQPTHRTVSRRSETKEDRAFSFWFRRPYGDKHVGAWMLSQSTGEASFLTSAPDAPKIGERLELTEPCDTPAEGSIPRFGRVVKLDESPGRARRVEIAFD